MQKEVVVTYVEVKSNLIWNEPTWKNKDHQYREICHKGSRTLKDYFTLLKPTERDGKTDTKHYVKGRWENCITVDFLIPDLNLFLKHITGIPANPYSVQHVSYCVAVLTKNTEISKLVTFILPLCMALLAYSAHWTFRRVKLTYLERMIFWYV